MSRDMTKRQFARELDKRGMRPNCFGYVDIGHGVSVYRFNAGDRLREQLRYLIQEQDKAETRYEQRKRRRRQ